MSVGGLGEGPQIGDFVRDRTQNLLFHKRIKLELELGILGTVVMSCYLCVHLICCGMLIHCCWFLVLRFMIGLDD